MPRPRRNTDPSQIQLVTIRTERAQLRLTPSEAVNEEMGGIIAKYQEYYGIVIFAYIFLSNHYHLLCQAPNGNLWQFEQRVNKEIAQRTNRRHRLTGHFWERRYDALPVLTPDDQVEALQYVVCNPVHHGLVDDPKSWPGLSCYQQLWNEKDRVFSFTNYAAYHRARRKARILGNPIDPNDFKTKHSLKISRLPQFKDLPKDEYHRRLRKLLEDKRAEILRGRKSAGKGFLGRKQVLRQSPFSFPSEIKRTPRPRCYTRCPKARNSFIESLESWTLAYVEASQRFRRGFYEAMFPPFSLKPSGQYIPT